MFDKDSLPLSAQMLLQGDSLKHVRPVQSQHTYILPCRSLQFCPEIAQVYVFVFATFIPVLVLG